MTHCLSTMEKSEQTHCAACGFRWWPSHMWTTIEQAETATVVDVSTSRISNEWLQTESFSQPHASIVSSHEKHNATSISCNLHHKYLLGSWYLSKKRANVKRQLKILTTQAAYTVNKKHMEFAVDHRQNKLIALTGPHYNVHHYEQGICILSRIEKATSTPNCHNY